MKSFAVLATTAAISFSSPIAAQEAPSGGYIGIAAGAASPGDDSSGEVTFDRGSNGSFGETVTTSGGANAFSPGFCGGAALGNSAAGGCSKDNEDYEIAARAGYDWSMGSLVVGGLIEVSKNGISDSATAFSTTPASYTFTRSSDYVAALRARAGLATGLGLIYGTAGVAGSKMDNSFVTTNTANSFTQNNPDDFATGYQLGGGVEFGLSGAMRFGVEYLYNSFSDDEYSVTVGNGTAGATNPFVLAGGVDMKPVDDNFAYHSIRATLSLGF